VSQEKKAGIFNINCFNINCFNINCFNKSFNKNFLKINYMKRGALALLLVFALCTPMITLANNPHLSSWEENELNHFVAGPDTVIPDSNPLWQSYMLTQRPLTRRQEGLDIRGVIPVINESFVAASVIQSSADDVVASLINEAGRLRARAISFRFEYYRTARLASVVIYADVFTTLSHTLVRSVNFCVYSGQILSMNEAMEGNITPLAERFLAEKIRGNPAHYYAALGTPVASQAFYLTYDSLVILFDGFRLSTRVGDIDTIVINRNNISTAIVGPEQYRTDGPYGLKMIPVAYVVRDLLGFELHWEQAYERINLEIFSNGMPLIFLREGENDYLVFGTQRRSLESAPENINGRIYVPITFFDQILPLTTYAIEDNGNITFLSYRGD